MSFNDVAVVPTASSGLSGISSLLNRSGRSEQSADPVAELGPEPQHGRRESMLRVKGQHLLLGCHPRLRLQGTSRGRRAAATGPPATSRACRQSWLSSRTLSRRCLGKPILCWRRALAQAPSPLPPPPTGGRRTCRLEKQGLRPRAG
uniref:Uncharacterized protein n=1 Tax=Tetraselmis sp. GSL018 TaxID=582737 RepID=A0A061RK71_9CHLO